MLLVGENRIGLNPCFSGSWVLSDEKTGKLAGTISLNPCFSGSWVLSYDSYDLTGVLDTGLNPCFSGSWVLRMHIMYRTSSTWMS